jgi:hypothetical protein
MLDLELKHVKVVSNITDAVSSVTACPTLHYVLIISLSSYYNVIKDYLRKI